MDPFELETYLRENIPLSKALGLRVKIATPQKVILQAPFLKNIES